MALRNLSFALNTSENIVGTTDDLGRCLAASSSSSSSSSIYVSKCLAEVCMPVVGFSS